MQKEIRSELVAQGAMLKGAEIIRVQDYRYAVKAGKDFQAGSKKVVKPAAKFSFRKFFSL